MLRDSGRGRRASDVQRESSGGGPEYLPRADLGTWRSMVRPSPRRTRVPGQPATGLRPTREERRRACPVSEPWDGLDPPELNTRVFRWRGRRVTPRSMEAGLPSIQVRSAAVFSFIWRRASGCHLGLRLQLEFSLARALDWRGNTNYRRSGGHQPSGARLDTWQLLPAGFYDFPGWKLAPGRRV